MSSFFNNLLYNFYSLIEPFSEFTLELAVWSVFIGIVIAILFTAYNKFVIGSFVRSLISREVFSQDKALTLNEAGFGKNIFIKAALRRHGMLRNVISSAQPVGKLQNEKFFISDEHRLRASAQYRYEGKRLWLTLLIYLACILLFYIAALLAIEFLPKIGELFNSVSELFRESARSAVSTS